MTLTFERDSALNAISTWLENFFQTTVVNAENHLDASSSSSMMSINLNWAQTIVRTAYRIRERFFFMLLFGFAVAIAQIVQIFRFGCCVAGRCPQRHCAFVRLTEKCKFSTSHTDTLIHSISAKLQTFFLFASFRLKTSEWRWRANKKTVWVRCKLGTQKIKIGKNRFTPMRWESRLSTDEQFSYRNWTLFAAIWCASDSYRFTLSTISMSTERERDGEHLPCSQDKWPYEHKPVQLHSCLVSRHHLWTRQCLCLYAIHAQWIDDSSIRPLLVSSSVRRTKEIQTKKNENFSTSFPN